VQAVHHGFGITVKPKDLVKDSKNMQNAISMILSDPKFVVGSCPAKFFLTCLSFVACTSFVPRQTLFGSSLPKLMSGVQLAFSTQVARTVTMPSLKRIMHYYSLIGSQQRSANIHYHNTVSLVITVSDKSDYVSGGCS